MTLRLPATHESISDPCYIIWELLEKKSIPGFTIESFKNRVTLITWSVPLYANKPDKLARGSIEYKKKYTILTLGTKLVVRTHIRRGIISVVADNVTYKRKPGETRTEPKVLVNGDKELALDLWRDVWMPVERFVEAVEKMYL